MRVSGFSKLSKDDKIEWLVNHYFNGSEEAKTTLTSYWHQDQELQKMHDEFIENTLTNFYVPFGIAPNFLINGKTYAVPMVIEESSVVAAASKSANFWLDKGGFKATVKSTIKMGHVHFIWNGSEKAQLRQFIAYINPIFFEQTDAITANMQKRGGGILSVNLIDKTHDIPNYYQLEVKFETCDSMGANFINSCLEKLSEVLKNEIMTSDLAPNQVEIIMCILSNYTPECIVSVEVSCPVEKMVEGTQLSSKEFTERFALAVKIAETQPYRAVTHNKGIMNGIDAVVLATGNDFRAVEASAHAYASRNGTYSSLTHTQISDGIFRFYLEIPLALGTVGGITGLHPLVKFSHQLLGNPSAEELMIITASVGLAQNFSALRSLTTTGIQQGHMKMHLLNILNQLGANESEKQIIVKYFITHTPHHAEVVEAFNSIRRGEKLIQ